MAITSASHKLFKPTRVGDLNLSHRVVFAPLTRFRANHLHVHSELAAVYYDQRASIPGTLLITEATYIAQRAGGYKNVPGIWNDEQIEAWKRVTNAVHARKSYIYLQLWALGRAAEPNVLKEEDPSLPYISASDVQLKGKPYPPRPLTSEEIKEYVELYAQAARNAVHHAGFDGVEIHGANGYLIDQFTQSVTNHRTDEYGGSIENRSRFALEVTEAVTKAVGEEKTGIRLSPWGRFNDMRGGTDPKPQFSYLVQQLVKQFPSLAYLHVIEPRTQGGEDRTPDEGDSNDFLREIWKPTERPFISAGGYTREMAIEVAEKTNELIAFGRPYISNPDLPRRLEEDVPLTPPDRSTFYTAGPVGYIDYPFVDELVRSKA